MIDVHCHILPGLDDGPSDMDESLAMLGMAAADGVRAIVATPHFGGRYDEPSPELVRALTSRLNELAAEEAISVRVLPGCEAEVHPDLPGKLQAGQALTLGDAGRYALLEVPPLPFPLYAHDVQFRIRLLGITPILAHAERLAGAEAGLRFVREFAAQGGLLQINADSLSGAAGRAVQQMCRRLHREGLLHIIASDGHSATTRPPLLTPCLRGFPRRERDQVLQRHCSLEVGEPPTV